MTGQSRSPLSAHVADWCDRAALFALLLVIGLRPLVQERASSQLMGMDRLLEGTPGPGPAFSVMMTAVILAAAILVGVSRVLTLLPYRRVGIELGFALLAIAAVASCSVAGNKRIAINETANWLALPLLAMTLCQVLRRPAHIRLAMAVIVASGVTFAFQCWRQKSYEFDDTIAYYEQIKERVWAEQGVPLDDPQVALFERRLRGREASGFFSHSNVAGSYLVCAAFVAAALALPKLAASSDLLWLAVSAANLLMALVLAGAVILTGSFGAMVSGVAGLVLVSGAYLLRRRITARPRLWLAMTWALLTALAAFVLAYGTMRGSLPSASLAFRWQYWTHSASLIADHPWLGVGAGNFGDHYLRYKPVTSPEEIKDPHNLLVTAAARWGLFGAAGLLAMIVGASIHLARPSTPVAGEPRAPPAQPGAPPVSGSAASWVALLSLAIFCAHSIVVRPFDYFLLYLFYAPFPWMCALVLAFAERSPVGLRSARVVSRCRAVIAAGLAAVLLHNTIGFSLYQYGSATTIMAALAICAALRHATATNATAAGSCRPLAAWAYLLGAAVAATTFACLAALSTVRVARLLTEARAAARDEGDRNRALSAYERCIAADTLDPGPAAEFARWLSTDARAGSAGEAHRLALARAAAETAVRRNPNSFVAWRLLSRLALAEARATGDGEAAASAIRAARRAVSLYPASPDLRVELADTLVAVVALGSDVGGRRRLAEAIEQYHRALELDARRDPDEIRRFPPAKRAAILERIAAARGMASDSHQGPAAEPNPRPPRPQATPG